jgi:hypothetical protein
MSGSIARMIPPKTSELPNAGISQASTKVEKYPSKLQGSNRLCMVPARENRDITFESQKSEKWQDL